MLGRLQDRFGLTDRERTLLLAAIALALVVRIVYVIATRDHTLAGDEVEYDVEARFLADEGKFLWSTTPFGDPHASTWKAPGYPLFAGILYALTGSGVDKVLLLQTILLTPLTVTLTFLVGRRLFAPAVGVTAAFLVAVYPNAWQFDVRLYSESLATPLTLGVLLALFAARRKPWLLGVLMGVSLLVRPSSLLLFAGIAVVLLMAGGLKTGAKQLAVVVGVAALVVVPWTIRNATLDGPLVPISVQTAAAYGTFNDDAANDGDLPWKWRPITTRDAELFKPENRITDGELYRELNERVVDYIKDHPSSVPKALFYNGFTRLWDVRPPGQALDDTRFEGRTRSVTGVGLAMYYVLAILAIVALVRLWKAGRRDVVLAMAAIAVTASVVYIGDAGTRYRAPLEPVIAVLAMSVLPATLVQRRLKL